MKLIMGIAAQLLAGEYTGDQFMKDLGNLVVILVSIVGALMTLYAVYIGYLFASASDANKRKAAKNRLIKVIASSLIIVALASVLSVINVSFNTVEGNVSNSIVSLPAYSYKDFSTANLSIGTMNGGGRTILYIKGSAKLDPRKLYLEEEQLDPDGSKIKFHNFIITKPKSINLMNHSIQHDGNLYFSTTALLQDRNGNVNFPCIMENYNRVHAIQLSVQFEYEEKKIWTEVTITLISLEDNDKINFIPED